MKPPYDITPQILKLISEISEKIGEVKSGYMDKPSPQLRKQNKIKLILLTTLFICDYIE